MVGYVQTVVTVLESDGVAHLNVVISRPATNLIATYFYLVVNTSDKSATATGLQSFFFLNETCTVVFSCTYKVTKILSLILRGYEITLLLFSCYLICS